ncbi:hypothetical protein VFPPC_03274 [Pochonia chlamydosporia 170]|uniref:Uncharacterized protein n=1 Tax=Pochonia chlamydosporia 170 TaxID=1380566 RepID=A0A179G0N8_METCM|nr:hypothetical protein VFPPC_03274 [Pochonia chlamydosporia 170]OAQ70883.2 hypothetical protein VFPPC_03274 [Pochonia chlamydosporia 170]
MPVGVTNSLVKLSRCVRFEATAHVHGPQGGASAQPAVSIEWKQGEKPEPMARFIQLNIGAVHFGRAYQGENGQFFVEAEL